MKPLPEPLLEAVRYHVRYARRLFAIAAVVALLMAASGPVLGAFACLGKGSPVMFFVVAAVPVSAAMLLGMFLAAAWVLAAPKDEASHPLLKVLRERPDDVEYAHFLTFVASGVETTHLRLVLCDGSITSVALPPDHVATVAGALEGVVPEVVWRVRRDARAPNVGA